MSDGLYLPDGSFRPFSAAELSTALATRQNAGVFYGELEGWLPTRTPCCANAAMMQASSRSFPPMTRWPRQCCPARTAS